MTPLHWLLAPANIVPLLCLTNFTSFAAFGLDKMQAEKGMRRTSEAALLWFAFLGGIGGAYAGRALFRHKTRKQPFSSQLHSIAVLQLCAAVFLVVFFW